MITKYAGQPVNPDDIEEVDFIGTKLSEVSGTFDHIVASHFIEHTTDLVEFLRGCSALLNMGGKLHLIVPDKRACFDALRPVTSTGHVIDAHVGKRSRHFGAIFDQFANAVSRNGGILWFPGEAAPYQHIHSFADARQHVLSALSRDEYVDAHEWCFTPSSFRLIVLDLLGLDFIDMAEVEFQSDPQEFYCVLEKRPGYDLAALDGRRRELRDLALQEA